jgi:regulator of sirC expression with transglutaminase-like and TPR domain
VDSFDVLRLIAKNDPSIKALYNTNVSTLNRCVATELMDRVHFQHVLHRLRDSDLIIHYKHQNTIELLEEGSLLFSESMKTWQDLLSVDLPYNCTRTSDTRDMLNDIARTLQCRLDIHGTMKSTGTLDAVCALNEVMFQEMGFAGNTENYYDAKNSSLYHVLKSRKGFPLTLAVLYKLVLNRVGIDVDIIGLPGHVVIGIPGLQTFVDVFDGGRILSPEDCREIVQSHPHPVEWRHDYLLPVSVKHVIVRMLSNVLKFRERDIRQTRSVRGYITLMRTKVFYMLIAGYPRHEITKCMFEARQFLDPKIFRHFGLIDEEKLTMCEQMIAPFYNIP